MFAPLQREGGQVQLEQPDLRLALNMATMLELEYMRATMEDRQRRFKQLLAKVQKQNMQGVEFPAYKHVKAAMEIPWAMVRKNQMNVCLPCQNGTAQNQQTCRRKKGIGAPQPDQPRGPTSEHMPCPPGLPPVPPSDNEGAHDSEIEGVPCRYVYIHTPLCSTQYFNLDTYDENSKNDKDSIPDLLTDDRTSTS